MDPITFLEQYVPGYAELSQQERDAISHFTLLWSAMEGRVVNFKANPTSLVGAVKRMAEKDQLQAGVYQESLDYFRARHFQDGQFTYHFHHLLFRENDRRPLVEAVIRGEVNDTESVVAALLLIIYRLRNNLFHGAKWEYGIQGQLSNFKHGSIVLMRILAEHPLL